ncbi:alpha-galactosidase [Microbacterium saperdae]
MSEMLLRSPDPTSRVRRAVQAAFTALLVLALIGLGAVAAPPVHAADVVSSGDASITFDPSAKTWTLETSAVRRVIRFHSGALAQSSLVNKATGREYQQSGASSEFRIRIEANGTTPATDYRGSTGGWSYDGYTADVQPNGSIELAVTLSTPYLRIVRHYWLYPQTSFIEERTDITNKTATAKTVNDYSALSMRVLGNDAADVDMYHMSGDKAAGMYQQLKGPLPMASGLQNPGGKGGNGNQEFVTLRDRVAGEGIVATWDHTGNWVMNVGDSYGKILIEPRATGSTALAAGQTITGPLGRIGFYQGDLDAMGNALLDFTYRYLWGHTDDDYFPLIRYGGYGSDPATIAAKIHQLAYIGGDMVWMDDGWQDKVGDWNAKPGEPLAEYRDFAALHGQKVGYWLVPWGGRSHVGRRGGASGLDGEPDGPQGRPRHHRARRHRPHRRHAHRAAGELRSVHAEDRLRRRLRQPRQGERDAADPVRLRRGQPRRGSAALQ